MQIVMFTDGGSRNNPGIAGAGVVIYDGREKIAELSKYLGVQTNNWAEYEAVLLALEEAERLGLAQRDLEIRLDSKLVAEQLSGRWKIKEPTLKPQAEKARKLMSRFSSVVFTHIPREENSEADKLANDAMDRKSA